MRGRLPARPLGEIADAAVRVFTAKGFRPAGISDLAAELGLSHGAVYTYADSKQALLYLALLRALDPDGVDLLAVPVTAPAPDEIVERVRIWVAREENAGSLVESLTYANEARPELSVEAELRAVVDALYAFIERNRTVLQLVEQVSAELPELAQWYFVQNRRAILARLGAFLTSRIDAGLLGRCRMCRSPPGSSSRRSPGSPCTGTAIPTRRCSPTRTAGAPCATWCRPRSCRPAAHHRSRTDPSGIDFLRGRMMTDSIELTQHGTARLGPGPSGERPSVAWRPVLAVTALAVVIHAAVLTRYGWFGDEFYYVICGRHPAWGYVDQPPLSPFLARLAAAVPLDHGLVGLRVMAVAFQAGCILLTAVLAAEFGGRRRAQAIAAGAIAASPVFVAASMLFGTTVTDQFFWVAVLVLVTRALRVGSTRAWLAAGLVAGLGLENKSTTAVLLLGIGVGFTLFRREVLRTKGPWLAGALAVLIELPNLVWDAQHRWVNLSMTRSLSHKSGGPLGSLILQLPLMATVYAGVALIMLWVFGVRQLKSADQRAHRWILVVAVVAVVLFTASGGKAYYPAPTLTALFAAGAVYVEHNGSERDRRRMPAVIALMMAISVVLCLPVLPPQASNKIRALNPNVMDTYGWSQFVTEVAQDTKTLPANVPIFTSDYEEAGALTILGPAAGVQRTIASGHNNYWLWGPPAGSDQTVFVIGIPLADLRKAFGKITEIGPYTLPDGLGNDETARGVAFYLCQDPNGSWAQLWPSLEHLD